MINCFIAAIALHKEQLQTADDTSHADDTADNSDDSGDTEARFDFSNYGYQPLAADYLVRFDTMTQAVSQFAATQGKTDVEPRTVGKRASNDPRGQHADYQEPAVSSVPATQTAVLSSEHEESIVDAEQAESEIDAHVVEATALANQAQTEEVSSDSEHLLEVEQVQSAARQVDAIETQETSLESVDAIETEQAPEAIAEMPTREEAQAAKSKTTIASYKNMIENVAEQLLPQTGMFNLTTPKVPKARSRKPKTEHKKPTQAEKLASDDSDSES